MRSIRSSLKGWKTAGTGLAVLIVMQAFAPGAGRSQEPAQPRIDEEIAKQEKIYGSRGADVPRGYVTARTLSDYLELLPSGFCDALGTLGSSDRWLDIGAGAGQAILDYYAPEYGSTTGKICAGADGKVRAVAMSIEDRRTDSWRQQAASPHYSWFLEFRLNSCIDCRELRSNVNFQAKRSDIARLRFFRWEKRVLGKHLCI